MKEKKTDIDIREIDLSLSCYGVTKNLKYDIAVIPWGATEPHNLHLPYLTDAILSHDIAVDAAALALERYGVRAMVLPPVAMGAQNPGQRSLKFCIHYRQETQTAILADTVTSLYHQGIKRILIINGHGGNIFKGMIRDLAADFPEVLIASSEWYKVLKAKDYFDQPGDHADEVETSVMMFYHPELVRLEEAGEGKGGCFRPETLATGAIWVPRNWLKVSHDTGIGDPCLATAEKGERFVNDIVEVYARFFKDFTRDEDGLYVS